MPRISVDLIYMQMAYQIAKLSYAKRRRVGCVIVKDTQIISTGYNGTPHGFENECEEEQVRTIDNPEHMEILIEKGYDCESGCCSKEVTRREVLHAESNALAKISKSTLSSNGADLYTTTCPCFDCAKLIIQSGIKRVFYSEDYRDMSGVALLEKAGIETKEVICWNGL
ncbi:dCMP deaminase family protein [bacterium]|nr:dCMP deaminase family protein [bacterium]MDB9899944.1 dCMP deaminase family protein [bacterium]